MSGKKGKEPVEYRFESPSPLLGMTGWAQRMKAFADGASETFEHPQYVPSLVVDEVTKVKVGPIAEEQWDATVEVGHQRNKVDIGEEGIIESLQRPAGAAVFKRQRTSAQGSL